MADTPSSPAEPRPHTICGTCGGDGEVDISQTRSARCVNCRGTGRAPAPSSSGETSLAFSSGREFTREEAQEFDRLSVPQYRPWPRDQSAPAPTAADLAGVQANAKLLGTLDPRDAEIARLTTENARLQLAYRKLVVATDYIATQLSAEVERWRTAFRQYGDCYTGCESRRRTGAPCSCGYTALRDEAFAAATPPAGDARGS